MRDPELVARAAPRRAPLVTFVTSQLSGSQDGPSFLPGTGERLSGQGVELRNVLPPPRSSGLGTARPRPEPRLLTWSVRSRGKRNQLDRAVPAPPGRDRDRAQALRAVPL